MSQNVSKEKKLTLISLILMIFTSVFGFTNIPRSFYLMGYAAIPWYIISAAFFFIPYAFMMAEYGAAFKGESGGIYSWMKRSVNEKYAFIGTFMWYASYVIWMVNISSSIWIVVSTAIFGRDLTSNWKILGLNSTQTMGLLGVILIVSITFIATKGLNKITKITSIGGLAVTFINLVLLFGSLLILALNGGHLAQPITSFKGAFFNSPNPGYQTLISVGSFMVFSIFAFGGIEVIGGLSDKTENAEKTFPKGVTVAAIVIAIGYAVGIFLCGIFTNWNEILSSPGVHMGNVAYVLMENLGYQIGQALGLASGTSETIGLIMSRYMGISMVLALLGAFFTLCYSPLKQLIEGTPDEMWPEYVKKIKNDMPMNAMWIQCGIVVVFVILVSFGGEGASKFFSKLILMTNVAMTIPYVFVAGAFPLFKEKTEIAKPFEIYKKRSTVLIATFFTIISVSFANIATILSPYLTSGDISSTIWMIAGPVFFTIVALGIYKKYELKHLKDQAIIATDK
ncbi:amino acid/polyamine/organocation transporter, APC superfamily (TC 2.A.3) [Cetobacterium ceti]|uniref:Amino acid/polyamine/organocation transporter, APC superfamily (TC 2.A.3) n=1 Tax=Cetobacterium ceti TaxID=180163 RepID=A0A1T4PCY7_9FUSO|nr:glutamate/gamma-aminobutyrate family transporter YjeM [Cetobacterium ceti]SJZ89420.1 amino acid/polyamine/organocation transporter, APC superfamily (TC 2.A.3) [Cetobacterium ceti]